MLKVRGNNVAEDSLLVLFVNELLDQVSSLMFGGGPKDALPSTLGTRILGPQLNTNSYPDPQPTSFCFKNPNCLGKLALVGYTATLTNTVGRGMVQVHNAPLVTGPAADVPFSLAKARASLRTPMLRMALRTG